MIRFTSILPEGLTLPSTRILAEMLEAKTSQINSISCSLKAAQRHLCHKLRALSVDMGDSKLTKEKLSDEELMRAYQLGDFVAFEILYSRHAPKVYGYLSTKLRNQTLVDEVFQETMLKLHSFRSRYDTTFPFLPWLFTICRNSLVDCIRRDAREAKKIEEAALNPNVNDSEGDRLLGDELGLLGPKEGSIIELHFLQGYSFDEVASHLKIRSSAARKISSRAIQKLRRLFGGRT